MSLYRQDLPPGSPRGTSRVCLEKFWWQAWARSVAERPSDSQEVLGQEVVCSGKCFTFLIFLSDRKAMQLDFFWQLFLISECKLALWEGALHGRGTWVWPEIFGSV